MLSSTNAFFLLIYDNKMQSNIAIESLLVLGLRTKTEFNCEDVVK